MNPGEMLATVQIAVTIIYATYLFWDRLRDKPRLTVEDFAIIYYSDDAGAATSIEIKAKVINRGQRIARWCEAYIDVVDAKTKTSTECMRGWWLREIPDEHSTQRGANHMYYRHLRANEWDRVRYIFGIYHKPIEGVPKEFGTKYLWPYDREGLFDILLVAISGAVKGCGHIQVRISKKLQVPVSYEELLRTVTLQKPCWQDKYAMRVRRLVQKLLRKEPNYADMTVPARVRVFSG